MAVATSTALAIGSIAASAGGAAMSFNQALKANNLQKQAERDAKNAMEQARKTLGVNYMAGLSIQKEPYELEREALLAQGAQAIQAGVESERGAAATSGRIQMAMNESQAGQRAAMGKELSDLEKLKAQEDARIATNLGNLDLLEAQGQQQIAADAAEAKNAAIESGVKSAASALQTGISTFVPLFGKGKKINPLTGYEKNSTDNLAAMQALTPVEMPSTVGKLVQGASAPTVVQKNLSIPAPQNPLIYPNQPAYDSGMYNPFNLFKY
jgi:hypothetical protein